MEAAGGTRYLLNLHRECKFEQGAEVSIGSAGKDQTRHRSLCHRKDHGLDLMRNGKPKNFHFTRL